MMKQCSKKQELMESGDDKISGLPDEILVSILSGITTKEAARCSVLSRRWTKLWYFVHNLDFDAYETLKHDNQQQQQQQQILFTKKSHDYVNWVNFVLSSHQGSTLHEFNVRLHLDANYTRDIDAWVEFAIRKKVECLTMNFANYHGDFDGKDAYPFPAIDSACLRKLYLESINIDGDGVENVLSSCPHLEELAIVGSCSRHLVHLNISGPSLCLKHLKIGYCSKLESIHLSATNLSSFEYRGHKIDVFYDNVPSLVKVTMPGLDIHNIISNFQRPNYLAEVETLKLQLTKVPKRKELHNCPEFPFLENLILEVKGSIGASLLNLGFFLRKAPWLRRVKIIMHYDEYYSYDEDRDIKNGLKCPLECLGEIEVVGFEAHTMETEFLNYLFANTNTSTLEKVIVDCLPTRYANLDLPPVDYDILDEVEAIWRRARSVLSFFESAYSLQGKLVKLNF